MIKLDADESMLLLITKNWQHKNVPSKDDALGSLHYIQRCCNFRVFGEDEPKYPAYMLSIYSDLCIKLLSSYKVWNILRELDKQINGWIGQEKLVNYDDLMRYIISELACRITTDLELDESLLVTDNKTF